jgi:phage-related protein
VDISEIPVLTKVVQKNNPATVDVDELVAQVKQALLPEIAEIVTSQLGQRAFERSVVEQQALSEYAESIQQDLSRHAQAQVGESIQSIEQAFREAMSNVGKQQLQSVEEDVARLTETQQQLLATTEQTIREVAENAGKQKLEEKLAQLIDDQQAQIATKVLEMQAQLEKSMADHIHQLQESSKETLTSGQEAMEARLVEEYKLTLQTAFAEFTEQQTAEFKQKFNTELSSVEAELQTKVQGMVSAQMQVIEGELNKRLKSSILEVLQGIKFVMPSI